MRLADKIVEALGTRSDIAGSIRNVGRAVQIAQRFELTDECALACEHLANSRPSSLAATFPLCRLPYPTVWLEWRSAARQLTEKGPAETPTKIGCLLEEDAVDPHIITATWAWRHESAEHGGVTVCPLGATIDWATESRLPDLIRKSVEAAMASDQEGRAGQNFLLMLNSRDMTATPDTMSRWMEMLAKYAPHANSEREIEGFQKILRSSVLTVPNHTDALFRSFMQGASATTQMKLINMWRMDLSGEGAFVQAAIALLNSKTCVENRIVDLSKLNASRARRRKTQLLPYSITTLRPSKAQQRAVSRGANQEAIRGHLVRGHLKVRRSGIFWWHHFTRGDLDNFVPRKSYAVEGI